MKKQKGFTLIELLAVISVLALILLIVIPQVLKVINSSKRKTSSQSVELYGQAIENAISNYFMTNEDEDAVSIEQLEALDLIEYKGAKVECNERRIVNRKIYIADCKVDNKEIEATYGRIEPICKAVEGEVSTERGTKYSCEVEEDTFYNFYVLGEEDNKVNLIMDRNICEDGNPTDKDHTCTVAWYDDGDTDTSNDTNSFGPITALTKLYNATKNWTNVPDINFSYEDEGRKEAEENNNGNIYGYGIIETTKLGIKITKKDKQTEVTREGNQTPAILYETGKPLKARLPKLEEVYNADTAYEKYCHNGPTSCPDWLTNGLKQWNSNYPNNDHISGISGYWLLSSFINSYKSVHFVDFYGQGNLDLVASSVAAGIRPIITVTKTDLS